jgi:hypothetical protein
MVSAARSHGWRAMLVPLLSARASASNWLTVCVARMLERPICLQRLLELFGAGAFALGQVGLHAQAASGVLSWCAASARKRFCVAIESFRRVSRSLTDDTSGATSSGTAWSSSGLRSSGLRARMRSSSWFSGLMPRTSASQTSSTASGRMTNCGSITPLMISVASTLRFSRVSATCTSASGLPGSARRTQM